MHELPTTLTIRPWTDELVELHGFDPASPYVELCWLPVLGPSATWLYRRLTAGLRVNPSGYSLNVSDLAKSLGLGEGTGAHSSIGRTLSRLVFFGAARAEGTGELAVRRRIAPLAQRQVLRLIPALQRVHADSLASHPARSRAG